MSLSIYGESDIGCTRTRNEDAIGWCQSSNGSHAVLVLADGMGGHGGGDVASKIVVDSVMAELSPWVERADVSGLDAINTLNRAVSNANNQIRHAREGDAERSKMGTTLLILWIKNDQAFIANVGDSRCYCLSADSIRQVTKDDTVAQAMVDDGSITESEIPHIPFKNVLTKAVGTEPEVTAEIQQISFNNDDAFILCSDGLTDSVNSEQWLSIMKPALSTEQQVKNLIGESLKNKANDNVSVMIVRRPS